MIKTQIVSLALFIVASPLFAGWNVYFTKGVDHWYALEGNEAQGNSDIPEILTNSTDGRITTATSSIYGMYYSGGLQSDILKALCDAKDRGLDVRFVCDKDCPELSDCGIPIVIDPQTYLMHNKFIIFDEDCVWTGSTNLSPQGVSQGNYNRRNNVIEIRGSDLTNYYLSEFNNMFDGKFHHKKDEIHYDGNFTLDGCSDHRYRFSPYSPGTYENSTEKRIIEAIETADHEIFFSIFTFTSDAVRQAMVEKWNYGSGVRLRGVFNWYGHSVWIYGEYRPLRLLMLDYPGQFLDVALAFGVGDNNKAYNHNKYMLIDPNHPESDPILITGSHNWTASANDHNDENTLIVHSRKIANVYLQEWKESRKQCWQMNPPNWDWNEREYDPDLDSDNDGPTDWDETYIYGTQPHNNDSDGDGLKDGQEIKYDGNPSYNPYHPFNNPTGTDTDALRGDTDKGGESDASEVAGGRNPLDPTDDQIQSPTPTSTGPTPTPTITQTPTITMSPTSTPSATPTDTPTQTPTITNTPLPVVPLALIKSDYGDYNLYCYRGLMNGDWTYWDAAARNPSALARDLWMIPAGNNAISMSEVSVDGMGKQGLAVLKRDGGIDQNIFLYNTPVSGDRTFWDALARNPSPLARDLWVIPSGNGISLMADADDYLAVMKNERRGDYNLYLYNTPAISDWTYWDAATRNPSPVARDLWVIPQGNDVVAMCGLDTTGDGDSDNLLVVRNEGGDYKIYLWNMPVSGDWTYLDAIARNPLERAIDMWMIPQRNDIVLVTGINRGTSFDELVVMENYVGDYNLYIWNAPRPGDFTWKDAFSRNPSPLARDLWLIPAGNNTISMSAIRVE